MESIYLGLLYNIDNSINLPEHGYDNPIDVVFQLQHFPFEENGDWSDKIEIGVRCENELAYKQYVNFWLW